MNIKEAINRAKANGWIKSKVQLAQILWPNSTKKSAYMNLLNLESGKSIKIDTDMVSLLCSILKVSADYLFGISNVPDEGEAKVELKTTVSSLTEQIQNAIYNY